MAYPGPTTFPGATTFPGGSTPTATGELAAFLPPLGASGHATVTGPVTGSLAGSLPPLGVAGSADVTAAVTGPLTAFLPPLGASGAAQVTAPLTGVLAAFLPPLGARFLQIDTGEAESYTGASADAEGLDLTGLLGVAESYTGAAAVVDPGGSVDWWALDVESYTEAWGSARRTLEITLDPDRNRPQYRLKVVNQAGDVKCELPAAQMGPGSRVVNGRGGIRFMLPKADPLVGVLKQYDEVQWWRGPDLVPGGWFVVHTPEIGLGGNQFGYECLGLSYYFERRLIGDERPELLRNGGFEEGIRFWEPRYDAGSNALTPPLWERTREACEGGWAIRVFADEKVTVTEKAAETAAVFYGNRPYASEALSAGFQPGGEQIIRDLLEDVDPPQGASITVEGHTADADGGTGYDLSLRRAQAARAVILAARPDLTVTAVGKGETVPVDDRHTEAAYRRNRRVVIKGTFTRSRVGHRQYLAQAFRYTQPAAIGEPAEIDVQAQARIDDFEGLPKDGWMMRVVVRSVLHPSVIVSDEQAGVDELTPVGLWLGLSVTVKVPADGLAYEVTVCLYPTAGATSFDQVSAKPNLKLRFPDTDPRFIIGGVVEHAQDPAFGKSDLNIQPWGPVSGFTIPRAWEWKSGISAMAAIDDVVRSRNGPDANISVSAHRRLLVIHPKQGRSNGIVFAAGDEAGDFRVVGYGAIVDGDDVVSTARVQSSWSGGGLSEEFVRRARPDGLVLESVFQAEQDTPSSTLRQQGRTAVQYGQSDVVTVLQMHPDDTTLLLEEVTIGDVITAAINDSRVSQRREYRIIEQQLDPNYDQLTYVVAPEV